MYKECVDIDTNTHQWLLSDIVKWRSVSAWLKCAKQPIESSLVR